LIAPGLTVFAEKIAGENRKKIKTVSCRRDERQLDIQLNGLAHILDMVGVES
jgi:hypothetical protein